MNINTHSIVFTAAECISLLQSTNWKRGSMRAKSRHGAKFRGLNESWLRERRRLPAEIPKALEHGIHGHRLEHAKESSVNVSVAKSTAGLPIPLGSVELVDLGAFSWCFHEP